MKILIAISAAVLFYAALTCFMNYRSGTNIPFPRCLLYSRKDITILSIAGAVISCTGLYFGTDSNPPLRLALFYYLCFFLAASAITDIRERIIPNRFILCLLGGWAVYMAASFAVDRAAASGELAGSLMGFVFSALVFGSGYLLMKNKLGGGDVKLTMVMGLILTGDAIVGALIYGLGLSILFAAGGLISGKMKMKDTMPFAPFLFLGTAAAIAVM